MKTLKHTAKCKVNHVQLCLFLILFTTAFSPLGVKAQQNPPCGFGGLSCSFSNKDHFSVFPCASIVTATINFSTNIEIIRLTFPNSFKITTVAPAYTLVGGVVPVIMPPNTIINGTSVLTNDLVTQDINPIANGGTIEVTLSYKNCNINNSTALPNLDALFFDCDGGTAADPAQYCASIIQPNNGIPGLEIISNGSMAQAYPSTLPAVQIISQAPSPQLVGNIGIPYTRSFTVRINSLAIEKFNLSVGDEDGVNESSLGIGTYNLADFINGVGSHEVILSAITPSNLIVPGANNSRSITFVQTLTLNCPLPNATNLIVPVIAGIDCDPCNSVIQSNINIDAVISDDFGIVSTGNSIKNANVTSLNDMCNLTDYNYEITLKTTGTATANLKEIRIPINNQSFTLTAQDLSIGTSQANLQVINSNYVTIPPPNSQNGTIIIDIQQIFAANPPNWPGFSSNYNNSAGAWITAGPTLILRIRLSSNFQNSNNCIDNPILITPLPLASNPIEIEVIGACASQTNTIQVILPNPIQSAPTPSTDIIIDPSVPIDVNLPTPAMIPFNYTLSIPVQSPFQIDAGSNPQIWCGGNTSYKGVFSLINGAPIPLGTNLTNLIINGGLPVAVNAISNANGTIFTFDFPVINANAGFYQYNVTFDLDNITCPPCPNCTSAVTFGTFQYVLILQAVCDDCAPALTRNIGCEDHTVLVHCPGTCNGAVVGIFPEPEILRSTFGYASLTEYYNNTPLEEITDFNILPGWTNLTDQERAAQLKRLYPYDIFTFNGDGEVFPEVAPVIHTSLSLEFMYPEAPLGDFFEVIDYKATFTPTVGPAINICSSCNEPNYTIVNANFLPSNAVPTPTSGPILWNVNMNSRELRWNETDLDAAGIEINAFHYNIELEARFRITSIVGPNLPPGCYPVNNLRCQFVSEGTDGLQNTSCDPWGAGLIVLLPGVEIEQNNLQTGTINLPYSTPNIAVASNVNDPNITCRFGHAIGIRHSGGNGSLPDFDCEFRPVSAWPFQILSTDLFSIDDFINGTSTQNYSSVPDGFGNSNTTHRLLEPLKREGIATNNFQGLVLTLNKDCPSSSDLINFTSNTNPPTFEIDQYAYLHDLHIMNTFPPQVAPVKITPNSPNITPTIPGGLNCSGMLTTNLAAPPTINSFSGAGALFDFNLSIPVEATGLPVILKVTIVNNNNLSLIAPGDLFYNGNQQTYSTTGWYSFNRIGFPTINNQATAAQIGINLADPCATGTFELKFEWHVFCDASQVDPFINGNPQAVSCSSCSTTRIFQRGITSIDNLVVTNNFILDPQNQCNLQWILNIHNDINMPEIDISNLSLNFSTGLTYLDGNWVISPGTSTTNFNQPTFNLVQQTTPSATYIETGLPLSGISLAPGETLTYTLTFGLSDMFCNNYIPLSNIISANISGNNVCNDADFHIQPIPINAQALNALLPSLVTSSTCCVLSPVTHVNACGPLGNGSIKVLNTNMDPANEEIEATLFSQNTACLACSTQVITTGNYIFEPLPIGIYNLVVWNSYNGSYFTQQIEILDYSFTVDPITANNNPICLGNDVILTAGQIISVNQFSQNLISYTWTPGTNPNTSSITVTTTALGTTTYNVSVSNNSCSASASIDITVDATPAAPTAAGITIPINTSTSLTVTAPLGTGITFQWYSDQNGTMPLGTPSASYTTPILTSTTSYWVQSIQNNCSSALVEVVVEVVDYCPGMPITGQLSTFFAAGATVSNTNFSLSGTLTIDHDIMFVGCIFKCKEGAKIYINPNAKATFSNCTLEACNFQLWEGIENAGTVHILDATTISGAEYGLFINNGVSNEVRQSTFADNYEGIRIFSSTNPLLFINSENNFTNNNQLLPHWIPANTSPWALCGIHLLSVGWPVNIDQSYLVSTGTHFEKINCGILSTNTDVSVLNCDFNNITDNYPNNVFFNDGCGIYHESINGNNNTLTVKPYEGITHSQMFVNCLNGISVRNSNANLSYLGFYNCNTGILGNLAFGKRVIMEYNHIEARRFGIDYNLIDDVNLFVINHNQINLPTFKSIVGIRINAASTTQSTVSNIKVQDNDVIVNNGFSGIEASSIFHPKINQNRITRELIPSSGFLPVNSNWAHIRSNGSDGIDVSCNNTFMGNNPNHIIDGDGADIQINQSKKSWVACNYTEGTSHKGIEFAGICLESTIQTNEIGSHGIGLYLDNTADVGMQPLNGGSPKGNQWLSSNQYSEVPAKNINIGSQAVIQNNQFGVNGSPNTTFWPDNYPDNDPTLNLGVNWFVNLPNDPLPPCAGGYCPGRPANTGSSSTFSHRMAVAIGTLISSGYPIETKWMQEYQLMKELEDNDSLRNSNDTLLQFYNDSTKLNFKKLYAVEDTLNLTHLNVDSIMIQVNLNDSLLKIIDEEIAIHVLLMNDSSFADTANLMIQQLLSQYQSLSALNKNLLLNLKNESISLASSALVRNNTIVPTNFNEFIEKKVNDIYLRTFGQGIDTLTNEDRTDLESIIHICPLAGGPAIYRARALYNLLNDTIFYNDRLVCANAGYFRESQEQLMPELKSTVKQSPKIDLFPNPANDQLMLLFGGDIEAGKIEIYNLTGAIVAKYSINKNTVNKVLDINEISEGYYMIHFNLGNYNTVKSFIKVK